MASQTGSSLRAAYGVVGSPVNLAARLQAQAPAGVTLISEDVQAAVEAMIELASVEALLVKGIEHPVSVWQVIGARPERQDDRLVPFVGRRSELDLLATMLDAVAAGAGGRVLKVRGEAGIGKTRLMRAVSGLARQRGFICVQALILDFGVGQGRDAARTLVAGLLGLPPLSSDAARREAMSAAMARGDIPADDETFLADLLDLPQPPELRTLYDATDAAMRSRGGQRVTAALARCASARAPLFLLVEDIHWADDQTLAALAALTETVADHRILLAMTSRINGDPVDAVWRARIGGGLATIDLGPLKTAEAAEFGRHLQIANDQFLSRCLDRASGNPLFLEQLLRNTVEGSTAENVPASIQSLVLERMDRLQGRDKEALQAASVGGQRFSLEFLRMLLRDVNFAPVALIQHQMIQPEGDEYLFSHALVRDAVYSSLTHDRRRALHLRAGRWFAGRDLSLGAEHLDRADDPDAPMAYHAAAQAEVLEYRWPRALALVERGRSIARRPGDCFALAALHGDCLREAGDASASLAQFEAALSEAPGDLARCRAHLGIAAAQRILSRPAPALAALDAAETLASAGDLQLEAAQIHYYRGNIRFAQGDTAGCLAAHQAAHVAAEAINSPEWRARALSGIGDATYSTCRMRTARQAFQDCVDLCNARGFGRIALPNRIMIAHCMLYLEQVPEAVTLLKETRDDAVRIGNPHAEMFAYQSLGVLLTHSGQTTSASGFLPIALEKARALGARRYEASILTMLAEVRLMDGSRAEALSLASNALELARATGIGFVGPYALAVLARLTDDPDERIRALAEGEAELSRGAVGHNQVWFRRVAGEVAIETGDWAAAAHHALALREVTGAEPLPYVTFIADRIDALVAADSECQASLDGLLAHARTLNYIDFTLALEKCVTRFGSGLVQ